MDSYLEHYENNMNTSSKTALVLGTGSRNCWRAGQPR